MKLTILGSGSPEAYARRASTGYLVEIGEDIILFDCGGGVFDNLVRSGRCPSDVTHLFFSHLHSDHMMDYARLVHAAWDEGAPPLKVLGPSPISRITDGFFGRDGVLSEDLRARTELAPSQAIWKERGGTLPRPWPKPVVNEIEPGFSMHGNGWTIRSCAVPHAQPVLTCMAFSLEANARKFVYSGDAGLCDDLKTLTRDADTLLHWCYRLDGEVVHPLLDKMSPTPSQVARMAEDAGVKRLLLTHFRIHMDEPTSHSGAIDALSEVFSGESGIVEDLEMYEI